MEKFYLELAERLNQSVEGLTLIDEDTGQLVLSETEDSYPVTFPCALIDISAIDWSVHSQRELRGKVSVTVKHAFDCTEDTHYSSRLYQQFSGLHDRVAQHRQLLAALHGWAPEEGTALVLQQTRHYTLYGRIKVYEEVFSTRRSECFDDL